ncbi:MAG: hypothetical protein ABF296_10725, partial [Oceanococcaceae bacterium]
MNPAPPAPSPDAAADDGRDPPVMLDPMVHESRAPSQWPVTPAIDITQSLRALPGLHLRPSGGLGSYTEGRLRGGSARQMQAQLNGVPLRRAGEEALNLALLPSLALGAAHLDTASSHGLVGDLHLRVAPIARNLQLGIGDFGARHLGAQTRRGHGLVAAQYRSADNDFPLRNPLKPFDPADPERRQTEPRQNADTRHASLLYSAPGWLALAVDNREAIPNARNSTNNRAKLSTQLLQIATPAPGLDGSQWQWSRTEERYTDRTGQLALEPADLRQRTISAGWDSADWHPVQRWSIDWSQFRATDAARPEVAQQVQRWRLSGQLQTPDVASATPTTATAGQWSGLIGALVLGEDVHAPGNGASHVSWELLPRAHLQYTTTLAVVQTRTQLSYRERAPTLFEKFGDRGLFRGNPQLRPERALALDLDLGRINALPLLRLYHRELRDAITPQYNARGLGRSTNAGRARITGISLEQTLALADPWTLHLRGDWLEARDRSDGPSRNRRLPGHPEWIVGTQLRWTHPRLQLRYAWHWDAGAFYDSPNLLRAPIVRQHDLHAVIPLAGGLRLT